MLDYFGKEYKVLPEVKNIAIRKCKEKAEELLVCMRESHSAGREMSLAITNLEQTIMWCTKAIVLSTEKGPRIPAWTAVLD